MEKIKQYSEAVIQVLKEMMTHKMPQEEEEVHEELLTDFVHHHYAILWIGFAPKKRFINQMLVHFQLKPTGKIWILANYTEENVAELLIEKGVLREDIVIGFRSKEIRKHSGYAVA